MKSIDNRVTRLFGIKYPIISGGMVWCSGAKLAAAVSNAGGLGLIGAGSLKADLLREHIINIIVSIIRLRIGIDRYECQKHN